MSKISYQKPPKNFLDQVKLLKSRGLIIKDTSKAEKVLATISYNRLSNYWYPMLSDPKDQELFKENVTFDTIFRIYQFDSELRSLVFNTIEQIEIAIRTQIIYHFSHQYNSGFWYLNPEAFESYRAFTNVIRRIIDATDESKQPFIEKYKSKYLEQMPPAWKSFELLSFRAIFSILKHTKKSKNKLAISDFFGLNYTVFISWVESLVYIRNVCAHHARLWNLTLTITPVWPKRPRGNWVDRWENEPENVQTNDKKLKTYASLCMMQFLIQKVNPYNHFADRLIGLMSRFEGYIDPAHMGFPMYWDKQPLWTMKED